MNSLKIREEKIDFQKIIEMNFKRESWGKKYTIYTCGTVTVNCEMESYNFSRDFAEFEMRLSFMRNKAKEETYFKIQHFKKNFSVKQFELVIQKKIKSYLIMMKDTIKRRDAIKLYSEHYVGWLFDKKFFEKHGGLKDYDSIISLKSDFESDLTENLGFAVRRKAIQKHDTLMGEYIANTELPIEDVDKLIATLTED